MKILIVEDEARVAELIRKGLERFHHTVQCVHTASHGWQAAVDGNFDVLILDVKLPDSDGRELCTRLREAGHTGPILMLTALDSVDDKVTGLGAGADDYLTKPFSFAELQARLLAVTRRPAHFVDNRVLSVGDLELYPEAAEAKLGGELLNLQPKEFAVLELLVRNAPQVMSREQILDRVWGTDFEPTANVVDAVIARLRTKIDGDRKGKSRIKTIRGMGYKIQE